MKETEEPEQIGKQSKGEEEDPQWRPCLVVLCRHWITGQGYWGNDAGCHRDSLLPKHTQLDFNSACAFVYAGTYTPTTRYIQTYDNKDVITLGLNIKLSTTCFQSPEHDGLIRIVLN